ncbi:MAG: TlpA family protein disulfide reductase [Bacteroidota bacterium]|jgi:thiol-disulfide isomerase/thioredoxin
MVYNIGLLMGMWLGQLFLPGQPLPFNFEFKEEKGNIVFVIHNAEERIICDITDVRGDSIFIHPPYFDSEIKLHIEGDRLRGKWVNYSKKGNPEVVFVGYKGVTERFPDKGNTTLNITGKWETWFDIDSPDSSLAIGVFNQNGNHVTGTFLTETGDHRYLEGVIVGNTLKLSVFDGAHAWLYIAEVKNDSMNGMFYSGNTYKAPFHARRNENAKLRDPNTITRVEGELNFSFPDLDSNIISIKDKRFQKKATIIQFMGSWCPNCMDEAKYFNEIYNTYHDQGLEIIGLAFERSNEFSKAKVSAGRFVNNLGLKYPVLIAGVTGKDNVMKAIPQIKDFISFPTTLFIDDKGKVVKVHAGFSGPATGKEFEIYKSEFEKTIKKLIR